MFPCKLIAFRSAHDTCLTHIIFLHLIALINPSFFEPMLKNQCFLECADVRVCIKYKDM